MDVDGCRDVFYGIGFYGYDEKDELGMRIWS